MNNIFPIKKLGKAAILTGCFFVCACENDVNEVQELGRKKQNVEEGRNISSFLSMNGKMRAHLTAPLLLRTDGDSGKRSEFPNTLHVDFYNDSTKQVESQLNAKYGRYNETEHKIYLRDNVVMFNIKGDTLFCEDLYWDQNTGEFYTNRKATVIRNYGHTRFTPLHGIKAKQDFSKIEFFEVERGSYFFVPDSTQGGTAVPAAGTPPVDTGKGKVNIRPGTPR